MIVRKAVLSDMPELLSVYAKARTFMRENGNPTQWGEDKPGQTELLEDISLGRLYAIERNGMVCGAFCLVFGDDPTYGVIEKGAWKSDTPYAAIHRLAGQGGGIFETCVTFSRGLTRHLRIDTHENNLPMQHLILKHGFSYCGIIYASDGTARLAYEWVG